METSVDGIFACGNVVHIHDLVDFVTQESLLAGDNAVVVGMAVVMRVAFTGSMAVFHAANPLYEHDGTDDGDGPGIHQNPGLGLEVLTAIDHRDIPADGAGKVLPLCCPGSLAQPATSAARHLSAAWKGCVYVYGEKVLKAFVTGATGFVGEEIARQAHAAGHPIRAIVRDPQRAQWLAERYGVELFRGNVLSAPSIEGAMRDANCVIHLVGIIYESKENTFERTHAQATRYVIDEAKVRLPIWKREQYKDGSSEWMNCAVRDHGAPDKPGNG